MQLFPTFSWSVPTKCIDDIGNSDHSRITLLLQPQLTKASYYKNNLIHLM